MWKREGPEWMSQVTNPGGTVMVVEEKSCGGGGAGRRGRGYGDGLA